MKFVLHVKLIELDFVLCKDLRWAAGEQAIVVPPRQACCLLMVGGRLEVWFGLVGTIEDFYLGCSRQPALPPNAFRFKNVVLMRNCRWEILERALLANTG